jgi:outer membrane protein assembly factor BamB
MKSPKVVVDYILSLALGFGLCFIGTGHFCAAEAADWPNWRGPNHNGISDETGWVATWPAEGPKILWRKSIGTGFASMAVSKGRLYAMGNIDNKDILHCFDAETGKLLWRRSYPQLKDPKNYEGGPNATPTVDGNRVYTFSKTGKFFCRDTRTGDVVWSKDLRREFGIFSMPAPGELLLTKQTVVSYGRTARDPAATLRPYLLPTTARSTSRFSVKKPPPDWLPRPERKSGTIRGRQATTSTPPTQSSQVTQYLSPPGTAKAALF